MGRRERPHIHFPVYKISTHGCSTRYKNAWSSSRRSRMLCRCYHCIVELTVFRNLTPFGNVTNNTFTIQAIFAHGRTKERSDDQDESLQERQRCRELQNYVSKNSEAAHVLGIPRGCQKATATWRTANEDNRDIYANYTQSCTWDPTHRQS